MSRKWPGRRWPALLGGLEVICGLVCLTALHELGWAIPGALWFFIAFLLGGALFLQWALRPSGEGQPDRIGRSGLLGTALQVAYCGGVTYLTGWGPVLAIGFVQFATVTGSLARSWRLIAALSVLAIAAGQAALAAGLLETYLAPGTAQAVGAVGALCAVLAIRALGTADAARDAAENALALSEQAARRSEERYRTVLQDSQDVTVITDAAGTAFFVSSAVEHVMGWSEQEYRDSRDHLVHPEDRPIAQAMADALKSGSAGEVVELRLRHGDGAWHWHEVSARNLLDNPAVAGIVFNHRDVTLRKQHQDQLVYEAAHDPLTGLANRAALREVLAGWGAGSGLGAILYLDLDGFKRVNDELGHAVGDELLLHAARVLRDCVLGGDTVARLGGDEFVVVLPEVRHPGDAVTVAQRIIDRLGEPESVAGHPMSVRTSVGIAVCELDRQNAEEALRLADAAMYEAKRAGTHSWYLPGEADREQHGGCRGAQPLPFS
ncbi:sensor domain-containing diguanylate cyclase [Paractinoplanes toevensis]|uniref:sensor domain-containing diguanylate cyclase n=1 Tax=Paractinoplanes toevensis TaxID=571911 RepID=UPI001BB459A4|nr:sensor domain-containing diguanylate cyclase [Actinoplanes toevensis]